MNNQGIYRDVKRQLEETLLLRRDEEPGERLASSRELAKKYQCSINTVERAIKELVAEGFLRREVRKGTFLVRGASRFQNKRSGLIAAFAPEIDHPLWATALKGIEDFIQPHGFNLMVASVNRDVAKLQALVHGVIAKNVDGVILSPLEESGREPENKVLLDMMTASGMKMVFLDRYLDDNRVPYVGSNNIKSAYQLTKFLIDKGHRRIAFFRKYNSSSTRERWSGYRMALHDAPVDCTENLDYVIDFDIACPAPQDYERFREDVRQLDFTAAFTVNCEIAKLLHQVLRETGRRIPEQVSLVTFDPEMAVHYGLPIPLTGVTQSFAEMGKVAAAVLLDFIAAKDQPFVSGYMCPAQLALGKSVR